MDNSIETPTLLPQPTIGQAIKAMALAPLASMIPVFIIVAIMAMLDINKPPFFFVGLGAYIWAVVICYGHIVCAALPFYLGIRKKALHTKRNCITSGAGIAGIPIFLLIFSWDQFFAVPTLIERSLVTLYAPPFVFALLGGLTGYVFWRIIAYYSQILTAENSES